MKCLSVRQPWVHAIFNLGLGRNKPIENRERSDGKMPSICYHRGPLLVHASATCRVGDFAHAELSMLNAGLIDDDLPRRKNMPLGAIVGAVNVVGHIMPNGELCGRIGYAVDKRWHKPGSYGLVFSKERVLLPQPVPWKGSLGLFEVTKAQVMATAASVAPYEAKVALIDVIESPPFRRQGIDPELLEEVRRYPRSLQDTDEILTRGF